MTATCPTCGQASDHVVDPQSSMYGCLTEDCRVATFFQAEEDRTPIEVTDG